MHTFNLRRAEQFKSLTKQETANSLWTNIVDHLRITPTRGAPPVETHIMKTMMKYTDTLFNNLKRDENVTFN